MNTKNKTVADRTKEIGRDGAYLELNFNNLAQSSRSGDLDKAQIITIKNIDFTISYPKYVALFKEKIDDILAKESKHGPNNGTMEDDQVGFAVFNEIFQKGLDSFKKE